MATAARLAVAIGYTFAAWVLAGMLIHAGYTELPHGLKIAVHCGGVLVTFVPVFRLYFRRPMPLAPAATAALAVTFIALLDLYLIAPHFLHVYDVYLSFWDWQLPAVIVAGSIYGAGRTARPCAQGTLNQR